MSNWRFYPLEGYPEQGIMVSSRGKIVVAEYLSLERAFQEARRKAVRG